MERGLARHGIVEQWNTVMDERVRQHARAEKIVEAVLYVEVDSTVWMNELAAIKQTLLDHLNRSLKPPAPPLQDIHFRLARSSGKPKEETKKSSPPPPPAPTQDELRRRRLTLEAAPNDEVRTVLERLMEKDRLLKWQRHESEDL